MAKEGGRRDEGKDEGGGGVKENESDGREKKSLRKGLRERKGKEEKEGRRKIKKKRRKRARKRIEYIEKSITMGGGRQESRRIRAVQRQREKSKEEKREKK